MADDWHQVHNRLGHMAAIPKAVPVKSPAERYALVLQGVLWGAILDPLELAWCEQNAKSFAPQGRPASLDVLALSPRPAPRLAFHAKRTKQETDDVFKKDILAYQPNPTLLGAVRFIPIPPPE